MTYEEMVQHLLETYPPDRYRGDELMDYITAEIEATEARGAITPRGARKGVSAFRGHHIGTRQPWVTAYPAQAHARLRAHARMGWPLAPPRQPRSPGRCVRCAPTRTAPTVVRSQYRSARPQLG